MIIKSPHTHQQCGIYQVGNCLPVVLLLSTIMLQPYALAFRMEHVAMNQKKNTFSIRSYPNVVTNTTSTMIYSASSKNDISMYFDDVSRYSLKWTLPTTSGQNRNEGLTIGRFDNNAASKLSVGVASTTSSEAPPTQKDEIIRNRVDLWIKTLTGSDIRKASTVTTSMDSNLLGPTIICHADTIFAALSEFWNATKVMIERDYSNHQLKRATRNLGFVLYSQPENKFVQYVVFPNAFHEYNDLVTFQSMINVAKKEHTAHLNHQLFHIEIYHPNQNTTSHTLCPYAMVALQYKPLSFHEQRMQTLKQQKDYIKQRFSNESSNSTDNANVVKKPTLHRKKAKDDDDGVDENDDETLHDNSIVDDPILDLSTKQNYFRRLYNKEAASATSTIKITDDITTDSSKYFLLSNDYNVKPKLSSTEQLELSIDSGTSNLRRYYEQYHYEHYDNQEENYNNNVFDSVLDSNLHPESDMVIDLMDTTKIDTTNLKNPSLSLLKKFHLEYRLRSRNFTKNEILAMSTMWIDEQINIYKNYLFDYYGHRNENKVTSDSSKIDVDNNNQQQQNRFWFGNLIPRKPHDPKVLNRDPMSYSNDVITMDEEEHALDSMEQSTFRIIKDNNKSSKSSRNFDSMEWIISNEKDGEYVYADLWSTMEQLHGKIMRQSSKANRLSTNRVHKATMMKKKHEHSDSIEHKNVLQEQMHSAKVRTSSFTSKPSSSAPANANDLSYASLYSWMNKIVKPVVVVEEQKELEPPLATSADDNNVDDNLDSLPILKNDGSREHEQHQNIDGSVMFVVTNLYSFNAEAFKRFAVTVHVALRKALKLMEQQQQQHITDGHPRVHYYLEVFHPEYVGSTKGYNHSLRRSPFPMIQICYQII